MIELGYNNQTGGFPKMPENAIISQTALANVMASEQETVVYRFRPCFWRMIFGSFTGLGILIMLLLPVVMIPKIPNLPPLHGINFIPLLILPLWWLKYLTISYTLTNQRLTLHSGILVRKKDDIELYRIKDIKTNISILNQIASIGSVTAVTTEVDRPGAPMLTLYLDNVKNPDSVHDLLRNLTENIRKKRGVREVDMFAHS
jgi:hypothetical protein